MPEAGFGSIHADLGVTCSPNFLSRLAFIEGVRYRGGEISMQALGRLALSTEQVTTTLRTSLLLSNVKSSSQHLLPRVLGLRRDFAASTMIQDPFKPAKRVAGQRKDVW
jgi:hypothetical protein